MKVMFFSDLQLGSGEGYGTAQHPRRADHRDGLRLICGTTVHESVELAVFAGDAFQHRRPNIVDLLDLNVFLGSLPCETILVSGNHDVTGPGQPSTLELFGVPNERHLGTATPFTRPQLELFRSTTAQGADLALGILPWTHPGSLRARRGPVAPDEHAEALVDIAAGLRARAAEFEAVPVLVTHYALTGMRLPNGRATSELVGEPVLDTHALLAQGWRFVLAGHVHSTDVVTAPDGAQAVSIGSPWVQDFGEADERHGVWILDTAADSLDHVEIPGRRFVTIDVDASELGPLEWFDRQGVEGAVVRVRIRATEEEAARVDVDAIRRELVQHGAAKVWTVVLDVARRARARAESMAEDVEPLAAVAAWCEATGQPDRERERLAEFTARLIPEA